MKGKRTLLFSAFNFIIYPLGVLLLFGWSLIAPIKLFAKEVIAFLLFSLIILGIIDLVKHRPLKRFALTFSVFILSFLAFTKLSFYHHYGVQLSASALFVIFETNATETSAFLNNYFDVKMIGLMFLLLIPFFYLCYILFFGNKQKRSLLLGGSESNSKLKNIALIIIMLVAVFTIHKKFKNENIPLKSYSTYKDYTATKKLLKESLAQTESDYIEVLSSAVDPQTYVVVIGESTSSWHMSLYGYSRNTNPRLSEIRDELVVFDSVIAPNVHTILALDKTLTLSDFKEPNKKRNASIVQLANEAGFTTYWISNQKPVGLHESISTIIASAANHTYFMATDDYSATIYDENLLPVLNDVLAEKDQKKLIFLHLIGTHIKYSNRYPESFNHFREEKATNSFTAKNGMERVNAYDNAVRYNDSIVREVIESVRKTNSSSSVTYFSDHGDEVYDTMELVGHNEYHGTRPMYEVPFLVWFSDKYKSVQRFDSIDLSGRRYSLEDYIHTFSELSQIRFKEWDSTRSLFSQSFNSRKRLIKEGEDYDNK